MALSILWTTGSCSWFDQQIIDELSLLLTCYVFFHTSHKIKMEFGQKGPAEAGQQVVLVPIEEEFLR